MYGYDVVNKLQFTIIHPSGSPQTQFATFCYAREDPYAVTVYFESEHQSVVIWIFARSLLTEGIVGMTGEGDVQVWPVVIESKPGIAIKLTAPDGTATLRFMAEGLLAFLRQTYEIVPKDAEDVSSAVDEVIELLPDLES